MGLKRERERQERPLGVGRIEMRLQKSWRIIRDVERDETRLDIRFRPVQPAIQLPSLPPLLSFLCGNQFVILSSRTLRSANGPTSNQPTNPLPFPLLSLALSPIMPGFPPSIVILLLLPLSFLLFTHRSHYSFSIRPSLTHSPFLALLRISPYKNVSQAFGPSGLRGPIDSQIGSRSEDCSVH